MNRLKKLQDKATDLALKAQAVLDDADMTASEKVEAYNALKPDIEKALKDVNDEKHLAGERAKIADIVGQGDTVEAGPEAAAAAKTVEDRPVESKTLGQQFVDSGAYKTLVTSGAMRAKEWTSGAVELRKPDFKALLTTADGAPQPALIPGQQLLNFQAATIAALIPQGGTDGNTIRYIRETTATNAADTVAEGALKPESALGLAQVDEPVRKIATLLPVTDEMLEDEAQIRAYIDNRLRLFVEIAEDDQLLNGTGVAPDLTGLLNRTGLAAAVAVGADPDTGADAVFRQLTAIRVGSFLEPTGIVMNPGDWATFRLARDGNGNYFGGGPFTGAAPDNLWGLQVVQTTRMAAGTALVGAFNTAAQIFRRGGIVVDATNSHADNFARNITTIRAEERLALAVYRPSAFGTVTGL